MSRFGLRRKLKLVLGITNPPPNRMPSDSVGSSAIKPPVPKPRSVESTSINQKEGLEKQSLAEPERVEPLSEQDEKILKHRRRTKVALLKLTANSGGTAALGDLHDLAEKRYFIAHKAFSDLMEEMVSEGLFLYDWNVGEATITDLGTEWTETDAKRGNK